jgi:CheY-like chemotaxis protein
LPSIETEPPAGYGAEEEMPVGAGERILYLDDEPALARLGSKRLAALDYVVRSGTDPVAALGLFRASPHDFDMVITDYTMPRMTGLDLAREVHAVRRDIPIIMLSGFVEEIPAAAIAGAGISRVLMKPASLAELAQAVHALLHPPA